MGKKVICQSTDNKNINKKQHLNTLIKGLRPKVYITNSSSFKSLVQQLTGNGNRDQIPCLNPTINPVLVPSQVSPVIEILDQQAEENRVLQESNLNLPQTTNKTFDNSGYKEIESWLLEVDQFPDYYDVYAPSFHQEVYLHEYELSGLL